MSLARGLGICAAIAAAAGAACVEGPAPVTPSGEAKPISCWYGDNCILPPDAGADATARTASPRDASFDLLAIPIREGNYKCSERAASAEQPAHVTIAELRARMVEGKSLGCLDGWVVGLLTVPRGSGASRAPYALKIDDDAPRTTLIGLHEGETRASAKLATSPTGDGQPAQYAALASLLSPGEANGWHLAKETHLVRVEINDGHGSPAGNSQVVVTDVMLLDKSGEYPIDVDTSIREFVDPFSDEKRSTVVSLRSRMGNAMANVIGNNPLPGAVTKRSDTHATVTATWHRDTGQLEILYYVRRVDRVERRTGPSAVGSREYVVEYAERALRDKKGGVVPTQPLAIEAHAEPPREETQ